MAAGLCRYVQTEVQSCAELGRIEQRQPRVHDLEVDLDEVQSDPTARGTLNA